MMAKPNVMLSMGSAFGIALATVAIVLALNGTGEKSIRLALELTARWSFLLFLLAYAGNALAALSGWTVISGRAREFGLSFASAHLVHVGLVIWLGVILGRVPLSGGLLLFFLIASTITNPNVIKLLLPKSSSGQAVSKKTISVTISQDLKYTVNNKPVKVEDMQTTLTGFKKLATELTIVLSVDRTVAIQNVVQVMDIAQKLNIKLVLATESKG